MLIIWYIRSLVMLWNLEETFAFECLAEKELVWRLLLEFNERLSEDDNDLELLD